MLAWNRAGVLGNIVIPGLVGGESRLRTLRR